MSMRSDDLAALSAAGRALSERRWGHPRVQTLVAELRERRDQLGVEQLEVLRELVESAEAAEAKKGST
jgi:hypothetical protein